MSIYSGVFDETVLHDVLVLLERIMFDDRVKQQFIPKIDVYDAVRAVQTANLGVLFNQYQVINGEKKDVDVEVIWENACDISPENNTTCVIGGNKSSTNKETYAMTYEKVVNFSVDEADFRTNEFGTKTSIAKLFLQADKQLVENFAQHMVGQIEAFKGVNMVTDGKGVVSGSDTYIEPSYWDGTLFAYFNRVAIGNRFTNPVYLSGQNFYEQFLIAQANAGNANGKGDATMFSLMKFYFDMFNVDSVLTPDLKTFMMSMGSLAFAFKWFNPPTVEKGMEAWRWTMPSRFVPEITYDVFYKNSCTTNDQWQHDFKVKLKGDIFLNPEGCEISNSGILSFICGVTP